MLLVADLQSWGRCAICGTDIWIEASEHEQRCGWECGACSLHNRTRIGDHWDTMSAAEFQTILDEDALL